MPKPAKKEENTDSVNDLLRHALIMLEQHNEQGHSTTSNIGKVAAKVVDIFLTFLTSFVDNVYSPWCILTLLVV